MSAEDVALSASQVPISLWYGMTASEEVGDAMVTVKLPVFFTLFFDGCPPCKVKNRACKGELVKEIELPEVRVPNSILSIFLFSAEHFRRRMLLRALQGIPPRVLTVISTA